MSRYNDQESDGKFTGLPGCCLAAAHFQAYIINIFFPIFLKKNGGFSFPKENPPSKY